MKVERELFELSAEITGISMIITGLSKEPDILTPNAMEEALFGISSYLRRIASDLENIEEIATLPNATLPNVTLLKQTNTQNVTK